MQRILFSGYAPVDSILSKSMSKGDASTNVSRLQTRLYALGYLSKTSSVDGDYGTNTANAVKVVPVGQRHFHFRHRRCQDIEGYLFYGPRRASPPG